MQKKVVALAVAGALAVPAVAIAQTSSVQISGRATYEWGRSDQGPNRPSSDFADNPGGSNVRFRGTENLGGGVSAWFQCESSADFRGVDHDGFCTRNSAVGFRGGFGNVFMGKWDTPMKRAIVGTGFVGAEQTGILGMTFLEFGGSGGSDAGNAAAEGDEDSANRQRWSRRESRLFTYETPNFGGFQVMGAVTSANAAKTATNATVNSKPRLWSIGGTYRGGPFQVGVAYEKHSEFGRYAPVGTTDNDDRAWGIGAAFTFGPVTVGATYLDAKYETGPAAETKKKTWGIGADWRLPGPHMLSLHYGKARDTSGNGASIGGQSGATACNAVTGCSDTGGDQWSLGYTYRFSKRTNIRLGYVRVDNDSNTNIYRIGGTGSLNVGASSGNGENVDGWAFLIKHDF